MLFKILLGLTSIFGGLLCVFVLKISRIRKFTKNMPGPSGYPIVGMLTTYMVSKEEIWTLTRKLAKTYDTFYMYWYLYIPVFNILTPEDAEIIMSSRKHSSKSFIYNLLHQWLGTGLLTSTGQKWQHRRKILTPAFHFSILQKFMIVFTKHCKLLVDKIGCEECNKPFTDLQQLTQEFALHTLGETTMGIQLDKIENKTTSQNYLDTLTKLIDILLYRLLRPWLYENVVFMFTFCYSDFLENLKKLHTYTETIIFQREREFLKEKKTKKIATREELDDHMSSKTRLAMLDLLLTAKHLDQSIDDMGIREEVDTFIFEGHETTAACISFTLFALANDTVVQNKMYEEIHEVLEDASNPLKIEDIQKCTYLDQVLKESLRLYPPVPFIARITDSDTKIQSGHTIPNGSTCHIHIYDIHHNEKYYPDPYKFDPERFSLENISQRHPFAYIPFSAGPRNCIGKNFALLEIKLVLIEIVKNFVIEPVDKLSDLVFIPHLVIKTTENLKVRFFKRN